MYTKNATLWQRGVLFSPDSHPGVKCKAKTKGDCVEDQIYLLGITIMKHMGTGFWRKYIYLKFLLLIFKAISSNTSEF